MANEMITAQRVRELFDYDQNTGVFIRKTNVAHNARIGSEAGWLAQGYRRISVDSHHFLTHRVAWLYVYGEWPSDLLDHIDGNPLNNAISNLRCADSRLNQQNRRKANKNSKSQLIGVSWCSRDRKWMARIKTATKYAYLGRFSTTEAAYAAYVAAKRIMHLGGTL